MKFREIVRVDSKGRVTIPLPIREALGIVEGMDVLMIADLDERKVFITPIVGRARLVEINVRVDDRPGIVAGISRALADSGIDIVALKCVVIKRGEAGECTFIVDLSKSTITSAPDLESLLSKLEFVREIRVSELRG